MKGLVTILLFLGLINLLSAQDDEVSNQSMLAQDSILLDTILTEAEFLVFVGRNHPIARQADLVKEFGEATTSSGRGGFDPKLFFDHLGKDFKDKNYYDLSHAGLKIPTWYGVEFKTGWEYSYGRYVNPENTTPIEGLGYAGVSVSAAQGLFMDKRRAELQKAKQFEAMSQNERDNLLNDLLRDAIFQYWEWATAYSKYEILKESLDDSETRYEGIRQSYYLGELSVLDTLEAFTQIQLVQTQVLDAEALFMQETFELNNYLWGQNAIPLVIEGLFPEKVIDKINSVEFQTNYNFAEESISNHPILLGYNAKLESLIIERKLKANKLLPKLKLQYNLLSTDYQLNPGTYSTNNYKWGVNFSMPLLLRKERGDLKLAKIKIEQLELKMRLKQQELLAKTNSYQVKSDALTNQSKIFSEAVRGYQILLTQEVRKLEAGESSLFKLTLRDIKKLRAQMKLIDINLKLVKAKTSYIHSSGALYLTQPFD